MKSFRSVGRVLVSSAVVGMMACSLSAAQQSSSEKAATEPNRPANQSAARPSAQSGEPAFLGVVVGPLHPALAAHFRELLGRHEGLEVEAVAPNSPAAKAGIKASDILISFADHKLSSPEQLLHLVHGEKSGSKVTLSVLHNGKSEKIEVTLEPMKEGLRPMASDDATPEGRRGRLRHRTMPRGLAGSHAGHANSDWERFDSLTLEKTSKDQFKVSIRYLNDKGKVEEHQFKGTREQLQKDIQNEKDLPNSERSHLLSALDMSDNSIAFPGVRFVPGQGLIIDLDQFPPHGNQQTPDSSKNQF